jgi:hypothetical protein
MAPSKKSLNTRQLETKFNNYLKKENKKLEKLQAKQEDTEWEILKQYIHKRDCNTCRLYRILTPHEIRYFKECGRYLFNVLDCAHVIPRSVSKNLYYEPKNIVLLDRTFHSSLDFEQNPLDGKVTSKINIELYWRRIVGDELYDWLLKNK